jgi:peptidoglycan/LPS O-acetylase OafA/YrhL
MMGSAYYIYRDRVAMTDRRALLAFLVLVITAALPGQYVIMLLALPYLIFFMAFVPSQMAANFGRWGDFSYGMYIYAWPVQQALIAWSHRDIGVLRLFALEFPVILILAVLSWHIIEKPALKLKRRFNNDRYPVLAPHPLPSPTATMGSVSSS